MNRMLAAVFACAIAFATPASLFAKGITTKITITASDRSTPVEITDRALLDQFNVWSGPGTFLNDVEATDGFIIDWARGAVPQPSQELRQFEVSFFVKYANQPLEAQDDQLAYVVSYAYNASTGQAYVYLPGRSDGVYRLNVHSILRGGEGQWFRPTDAWQHVVAALVSLRQR